MNSRIFNSFNNVNMANINKIASTVSVISTDNKSPIFGVGASTFTDSSNNQPTNSGYSLQVSVSQDDNFLSKTLNFNFKIDNVTYNTFFPSSNAYQTFGTGSTLYSGLNTTNPPYPKIMIGSSDKSWQRVWDLNTSNYYRIRVEGTNTTSGAPGSPNLIYELTLVKPGYYNDKQYVEVLFGNNSNPGGSFLVANTNTSLTTNSITQQANKSYVFEGNSTGTSWTIYTGSLSSPPY